MFAISILLASFAQCSPFLVFDKKIIESDGKVNNPVHVLYRIFNLGDSPATNLHIDDSGIPLEQWDFPAAANDLRWNSIGPGENISHIFEAKPLIDSKSTRSIGAKGNLKGYLLVLAVAAASVFLPLLIWLFTRAKPAQKTKTN